MNTLQPLAQTRPSSSAPDSQQKSEVNCILSKLAAGFYRSIGQVDMPLRTNPLFRERHIPEYPARKPF